MSEGSNKFMGDYGFDWITLRGWPAPEFIELACWRCQTFR
jgi:hypothetical protein